MLNPALKQTLNLLAAAIAMALLASMGCAAPQPPNPIPAPAPPSPPPHGKVRTPNLVGMHYARAAQTLSSMGLGRRAVYDRRTRNHARHAEVYRQSPGPGAWVGRNAVVTLHLYEHRPPAPKGMTFVPLVVDLSLEAAVNKLKRAGLNHQAIFDRPTRKRDKGRMVYRQNPPARSKVRRGSAVNLHIYKLMEKTRKVRVPKAVGFSTRQADRKIRRYGLIPRFYGDRPTNNPTLNNMVYRQNPSPGARLPAGGIVSLHHYRFEKPQALVVVPNLLKQKTGPAARALKNLRLRARVHLNRRTNNPAKHGVVYKQIPGPGSKLRPGRVVALHAYKYIPPGKPGS